MKKLGRPKKLQDEDYKTVEKLAKLGLTKEMIADYLDYSYSAMYIDEFFMEVYKKAFTQLGAKVRTTLISKMKEDTTANIYLDKVINKTLEKQHEENIKLKKEKLEIMKKQVEINEKINNSSFSILEEIGKMNE